MTKGRRAVGLLALILGLWGPLGCGEEFSNGWLDDDAAFLEAVPRAQSLRVLGPGEAAQSASALGLSGAALGAQTAETWRWTRELNLLLEQGLLPTLRAIEDLVALPPSERSQGRRVWGPFTSALDPLESRFVMERDATGVFHYALEQRSKRSPDAPWRAPLSGSLEPRGGKIRQGQGRLVLDADLQRELGASSGGGQLEMGYGWEGADRLQDLELSGYRAHAGEDPQDLAVRSQRTAAGGGRLEWAGRDEDGLPYRARSRWRPDGQGRAEVLIQRRDSEQELRLDECWDSDFQRVWAAWTPAWEPDFGVEAACALGADGSPWVLEPPAPAAP